MTHEISAVVETPGKISLQEFPLPEIGDEDGLLHVDMVGVCSSDYKYFHGKVAHRWSYPIIMGHEMVGRLAKVGKNVQKRLGVKEGDRLVVEAQVGCNQCWYCHTGNRRLCRDAMVYGSVRSCAEPPHLWGAYGQYVYLPPGVGIHKAPDGLTDESAVLITAVLANGVRWARDLGGISVGDAVVVQGPGPQGLCACAVAKHTGAGQVIVTGLARDAKRLEAAKRFGADHAIDVEASDPVEEVRELTGGRMADVVVDVTGSPAAASLAPKLARRLGTVVLAGLTGGQKGSLELDPLVWGEIRIQGAYSHTSDAVRGALDFAANSPYPFEEMVTHRFPLAEAERAVRITGGEFPEEEQVKTVLQPWRDL